MNRDKDEKGKKDKDTLFGIPRDQLKIVVGSGGIIIQIDVIQAPAPRGR